MMLNEHDIADMRPGAPAPVTAPVTAADVARERREGESLSDTKRRLIAERNPGAPTTAGLSTEPKFSHRDDAERLRVIARNFTYNEQPQATWKHILFEVAKLTCDSARGAHVSVKSGDRIAQAMLEPAPQVEILEVDELSTTERGTDGFGSTGK